MKTQFQRIPTEWTNLVQESIKKIEENGYPNKIRQPEIVRLLLHYTPAKQHLIESFKQVIEVVGIEERREEVKKWMKG